MDTSHLRKELRGYGHRCLLRQALGPAGGVRRGGGAEERELGAKARCPLHPPLQPLA